LHVHPHRNTSSHHHQLSKPPKASDAVATTAATATATAAIATAATAPAAAATRPLLGRRLGGANGSAVMGGQRAVPPA